MSSLTNQITANMLLAALPGSTLRLIEPHLKPIALAAGDVVHDVGVDIERVYFPSAGIASMQVFMRDGRPIETAMIGRDGALGTVAVHGVCRSEARCIARTTIDALTISADEYRCAAADDAAIQMMIVRDRALLLSKTQTSLARYAYLSIDVRMATCFIEASDLLRSDGLPLTHEVLAEMLMVRRTSVTEAACKLRAAGIIDYVRGKVQILDRDRLLRLADFALL